MAGEQSLVPGFGFINDTDAYQNLVPGFGHVTGGVAASVAPLKSVNGLLLASIKSINGLAIASVKSVNGLSTT